MNFYRPRSDGVPISIFLGTTFLMGVFLAASLVLGVLGTIAFANQNNDPAQIPLSGFRRDFAPNFDDFFFLLNSSDPNPSYIQFNTPPLAPTINEYQFLQGNAFDISDPETAVLLETGVYTFTGFFSFISTVPQEIALILTANNETLLTTPVVDGTLTIGTPFGILGNSTITVGRFAATAFMEAGTTLRVGTVTSGEVIIAPGGYWAGIQISN